METQFPLGPYRLDFALPIERIDIEADGWVHTSRDVRARDRVRDRQLKAWGWKVVRIDVSDGEDIRERVRCRIPSRDHIREYGETLLQIEAAFELQLSRLLRRGVTDPVRQLELMRDALLAASKALRADPPQ